MRVVELTQGTSAWRSWRSLGLGASDAPAVVGVSPWRSRESVLADKVAALKGRPPGDVDSWAMARGRRLEPVARRLYESLAGRAAPPLCAEHPAEPWLRASCDGYVAARALAVEIKCPGRDDHDAALAGAVPDKYVPQLHHQMLVTSASAAHYVSYTDSARYAAADRLAVVPVARDDDALALLFAALREFWGEVLARLN